MTNHKTKEEINKPADVLFWIDCEMTGLDVNHDELIEIAIVPTDLELNYLDNSTEDHGIKFVIKPTDEGMQRLLNNEVVKEMHEKSGLTNELKNGITLEETEENVLKYLKKFAKMHKSLLSGNTVYQDRKFLDKYLPKVSHYMHYRLVDVSTIKELSKKWYPDVMQETVEKDNDHRALGDILESIDELRYYRSKVFI